MRLASLHERFGMPGDAPPEKPSSLSSALCVACAGTTHASVHTLAPGWNADSIEGATRLGNVLKAPVAKSALGAWYAMVPQPVTLQEFLDEDRDGGFWTPLGVVCRACSGMPGVGDDWRASAWVARCWCGWSRAFPYMRSHAKERAAARKRLAPPDPESLFAFVETDQDAWTAGERRATRSLCAHAAAKHREVRLARA